MNKTHRKGPNPEAEYREAQIEKNRTVVPKTDSLVSNGRSIVTSRTEGDIEVIIVNKPQPTKDLDNSTS